MIIGICGAAGSGKDTLAHGLSKEYQIAIHRMADPLKRGLEVMFGLDPSIWDDREKKEEPLPFIGRSPRYLAQTLGTEWGRQLVHRDVWVLIAALIHQRKGDLIIPDIRFMNEAKWVKDQGGFMILVVRPDADPIPENSHSSEGGIRPAFIDYTIVNDGTIYDLLDEGREVMKCGLGR